MLLRKLLRYAQKHLALISLVVSLAAVLLSQFRPLYTWLDQPEIDFTLPRRLQVDHYFGHWRLATFCQIRNVGRATGRILKVEAMLTQPSKTDYRYYLIADYYTDPDPGAPGRGRTLPVNNVMLRPDETWQKRITFQPPNIQPDENKIIAMRREILAGNPATGASLTSSVVQNGKQIEPGEYLLFVVLSQDRTPLRKLTHAFKFRLNSDHVDALHADMSAIVDRITQKTAGPFGVWIDIVEVTDGTTLAALQQMWKAVASRSN